MNEINGNCVNVVLGVEEGRGMDFLKNHVQIVTNFNGRILESDYVEAEECPLFNTELVWETEKKELRKIRSANTPLRVDVRTFDTNNRKIRIGYLLLNPRSAIIITKKSTINPPFKWHKLIGVPPEFKNSHPELFVSLTIRDHVPEVEEKLGVSVSDQIIVEEEENESSGEENSGEKIAPVFPVKYYEDGFIQVGEDNQITRSFNLCINIKTATNLDLLLPEVLVFTKNTEKYFLSFSMFGIVIKTKPFWRELHQSFLLNEKVVISLLSSYEILRAFFEEHCEVMVRFYCGRDKLGMTKVNVQNLFTTREELKEYTITESCRFKYPSPHGIVPVGAKGRKPSVEVETTLECKELPPHLMQKIFHSDNGTQNLYEFACGDEATQDNFSNNSSLKNSPHIESTENGETGIDSSKRLPLCSPAGEQYTASDKQIEMDMLLTTRSEKKSASVRDINTGKTDCTKTKSETCIENFAAFNLKSPKIDTSSLVTKDCYKKFTFEIQITDICWKIAPTTKQFLIKFKHPRANAFYIVNTTIDDHLREVKPLNKVKCRLTYISTPEEVRKLLFSWPAKVVLTDESENILTEEIAVYTAGFLAKDRKECSYQTEWKSFKKFEPIAKLSISLHLQEHQLSASIKSKEGDLEPSILDEKIAAKELDELQQWKIEEKDKFKEKMKILQNKHITVLQKDWIKTKNQLEEKLTKNIGKIKVLKKELQLAVNKLRLKDQIQKKENAKIMGKNIQTELERYSSHDRKDLIQTLFKLEQQNLTLKELVDEQQSEIEQIKRTALTKEQTTTLLQELRGLEEKFHEAQKTKNYFKDQWKKAVREIHELRTEDHKQMQNQIKSHKEELSQLSLDQFFKTTENNENQEIVNYIPISRPSSKSSSNTSSFKGMDNIIGSNEEYYTNSQSFYQNIMTSYDYIHNE